MLKIIKGMKINNNNSNKQNYRLNEHYLKQTNERKFLSMEFVGKVSKLVLTESLRSAIRRLL